jgi:hypothetical protein
MRRAAFVFFVMSIAPLVKGRQIVITAKLSPTIAAIGQPLRLRVDITNAGEQPILLLARDANFTVEVRSGQTSRTVAAPRYTRRTVMFRDDEIPLRPGDSYGRTLAIPLNDLRVPLDAGWLAQPGAYSLRVRYDSSGSTNDFTASIWKGLEASPWITLVLHSPRREERDRRLKELDACVMSDTCDAVEAANFYRVVRDERAHDLLLQAIEKKPYSIWLLDAIVFQGRASDSERLRALAGHVDDDAIRHRYESAAAELAKRRS